MRGVGDFSTDGCRGLLLAVPPRALGAEDIVVARDAAIHAVIAVVGKVQPLTEQLFPAVLAIRGSGIGALLAAVGVIRILLIMGGIHTCRRGVEYALYGSSAAGFEHIQVNRG